MQNSAHGDVCAGTEGLMPISAGFIREVRVSCCRSAGDRPEKYHTHERVRVVDKRGADGAMNS